MCIYIYIYRDMCALPLDRATPRRPARESSEGGMLRLETLIELKLFNSNCSSLSSY